VTKQFMLAGSFALKKRHNVQHTYCHKPARNGSFRHPGVCSLPESEIVRKSVIAKIYYVLMAQLSITNPEHKNIFAKKRLFSGLFYKALGSRLYSRRVGGLTN
jgi:hypothetical protein